MCATIEQCTTFLPTTNREQARTSDKYLYIDQDNDPKRFRKKFNFKANSSTKTFYDPCKILQDQIPSLIKLGIAQQLLPIVYAISNCIVSCLRQ